MACGACGASRLDELPAWPGSGRAPELRPTTNEVVQIVSAAWRAERNVVLFGRIVSTNSGPVASRV